MPSGHSGTSIVTYYLVNRYFTTLISRSSLSPSSKSVLAVCVTVYCFISYLMIAISRVYLGVHSWNQVVMGSLISLVLISFFSDNQFLTLLRKANKQNRTDLIVGVVGLLFTSIVTAVTVYLREGSQPDPDQKYWDQCPSCQGSFLLKSFRDSGNQSFFWGVLVSVSLNISHLKPSHTKLTQLGFMFYLKRFGVLIGLMVTLYLLPVFVIAIPGFLITKDSIYVSYV